MIRSMTAFARSNDKSDLGSLTCELRSVNHRYLDISFRLPEILRGFEPQLRELLNQELDRGKVECTLLYQNDTAAKTDLMVNTDLVKKLSRAVATLSKTVNIPLSAINPMQILLWDKVLQTPEADITKLQPYVLKLFKKTLLEFVECRKQEGKQIHKLIEQKLHAILREIAKVKKILPQIIKQQRTKLTTHFNEIKGKLDTNRLEQEMVMFALKIDVVEELERLAVHVQETRRVLTKGGAIGKRLDFLMQELNREANTLGSKSVDKHITHIAVELKVLIEQMREQIQNVE
jgi:uncharacterized protein (TIGR00255 family)